MAKISILKTVDNFNKLHKSLKFLKDNAVYVGVPQETVSRKKDDVTNAELLYIHSAGSPVNNVPARPVVEPALKDSSETMTKMLKVAGKLSLDGKDNDAMEQLKKTGMKAQVASRAWFTNPKNSWAPNSKRVADKKRKKGANDPKPLIDTGELRKSITYFVDTKEGRVK